MRLLFNIAVSFLFFAFVSSHPFHSARRSSAGCTPAPEQIEGPYWVDGSLVRSDIREGQKGVPLYLNLVLLNASDSSSCLPLVGAAADIWHTNASGYYAHFTGYDPDKPAGGIQPATPTDDLTFFRGVQISDKNGHVNFTTIYPGWYYGRCIHIHVEVHLQGSIVDGKFISGGSDAYTGQVFFDDSWTAKVSKLPPYNAHTTMSYITNAQDSIFKTENGKDNMLDLVPVNPDNLSLGFHTTFVLSVDTSELQQKREMSRRPAPYWRSYAWAY